MWKLSVGRKYLEMKDISLTLHNLFSVTGSNIRKILNETGVLVVPGKTTKQALNNFEVYSVPSGEEWRIPLLSSLIEMKEKRWVIQFDEEDNDILGDEAIDMMIDRACID